MSERSPQEWLSEAEQEQAQRRIERRENQAAATNTEVVPHDGYFKINSLTITVTGPDGQRHEIEFPRVQARAVILVTPSYTRLVDPRYVEEPARCVLRLDSPDIDAFGDEEGVLYRLKEVHNDRDRSE